MPWHVVPVNDEAPHDMSAECKCGPRLEWADPDTGEPYALGPLVVHEAFDCRQVSEEVTGEAVSEEQGWELRSV